MPYLQYMTHGTTGKRLNGLVERRITMKTTVTLFGLGVEVSFDNSKTFEFTTTSGDVYDQAAVTDDNRLIAFDNAVCAWVQLSGDAASEGL